MNPEFESKMVEFEQVLNEIESCIKILKDALENKYEDKIFQDTINLLELIIQRFEIAKKKYLLIQEELFSLQITNH